MSAPKGDQPPAYAPGYPQQSGYPPQQPGYPPQQPGYPPQQPGYPPQQPGYPPQQPGYPPQQPGYPPQQPGYPPQQLGYPPQQPNYPPASGQQMTTVVVGVPAATVSGGYHESPMNVTCPQCRQNVVTSITYENGIMTWLMCGLLILIGCWLGCCFIPFCVDDCQDVRHFCPNCHITVGFYKRA